MKLSKKDFGLTLGDDLKDRLKVIAKQNERSMAAEARLAITAHVIRKEQEIKKLMEQAAE